MGLYKSNRKSKSGWLRKYGSKWASSMKEKNKLNPWGFGIANYCGPGTQLKGQKCKNKADCVCKQHDYDYNDISTGVKEKRYTHEQAKSLTRSADNKMLHRLKGIKDDTWSGRLVKNASYYGIKAKTKLEDWRLLDPLKFSTASD